MEWIEMENGRKNIFNNQIVLIYLIFVQSKMNVEMIFVLNEYCFKSNQLHFNLIDIDSIVLSRICYNFSYFF